MKASPTLADAAVRKSYQDFTIVPRSISRKIIEARKFVLDDEASSFLADLSHASYVSGEETAYHRAGVFLDQARQMSRSPHAVTWIEYNHRIFRKRSNEAYGGKFRFMNAESVGDVVIAQGSDKSASLDEVNGSMGWLIEQESECQFRVTTVAGDEEYPAMCLPHVYVYTTNNDRPTYKSIVRGSGTDGTRTMSDAYLACGLSGSCEDHVVITVVPEMAHMDHHQVSRLVVEFIGELRYLWALLSTINDVPFGVREVKASKGFMAKGHGYRRFLDHKVLSVLIPKGKNPRVVARQAVEQARRRAHMVRGHWRTDWVHPGNLRCDHEFYEHNGRKICLKCEGEKYWIAEHQRGDPRLGFITHDYSVKHDSE